jgi:type I restriction enzyme, S subunit
MSFPKYEVYKDSGVEWLGEVPEQWKVVPFSLAIEYQEGPGIMTADFHDEGVPLLRISGVQQRWANLQGCNYLDPAKVKSKWSHFQLEHGDLLISASASMGTICEIGEEAVGAIPYTGLIRLKPRLGFSDKNFVRFIVGSFQFSTQIDLFKAGSTIQHFGPTHLSQMKVVLPPISEQTQIARFLDRETARIDALIAEQQRLIELLKEKRQAVISHAVTKGIDRTVPMKDSGVEWLGEVPEHWEICQSKHLFDSVTSGSRGWAEYYSDDGHLFFRIANLTRDTIDPKLDSKQFVNPPVGSEGERSKIRVYDILISITADLGSVCVANPDIADGYVSQHVALVRPNEKKVFSRWLAYFVLSSVCKEQLLGAGYGGTKIQLSLEDIRSFLVAAPPYEEQILIAAFLDSEISKFESLINEAVLGIALLTERRSALISAAVTGKIDVRNWQPSPETSSPVKRTSKGTL